MAANIHRHPAPNRALGELLPGWFDVPQNPITQRVYGTQYTPTLGEIMPGSFAVPQNPLVALASGSVLPLAMQPGAPGKVNGTTIDAGGGAGVGCGCGGSGGGSCSCSGGHGMGDISTDLSTFMTDLTSGNFQQALFTDTIMGFPSWAVLAVLTVGGMYIFGGTGPSRAKRTYTTVRRKVSAAAAA